MKAILLAAAAMVAVAGPALAQTAADAGGKWMQPQARADAQAKSQARFVERDTNHDGFLSADEFSASARNASNASMAFAHIDADHDGRISQAEAVASTLKRFDMVDANHDGTVTADERQAAMQARAGRMGKGDAQPNDTPPPAG